MRDIWVHVPDWDKRLVTTALEGGADGIVVPPGCAEKVRQLGKITVIAEDGDLKIGEDVVSYTIQSGADEAEIARLSQSRDVILECSDWTIIPLENLIAMGAAVIPRVTTLEQAQTAFGILEKGVDRVLLDIPDPAQLKAALSALRHHSETVSLTAAEIVDVQPAGMGDRVCVDTCSAMGRGQGILVGNSSAGLFLVHAESIENPYVAPRPFRVNAGPVHAYTRIPGGKTRYLSELTAGDPVMIVDHQGATQTGTVGRLKIEKRPLLLVTAVSEGHRMTALLQNAETIRLTDPQGEPVSVVQLETGSRVLVAVESAGRHFGMKITETITER